MTDHTPEPWGMELRLRHAPADRWVITAKTVDRVAVVSVRGGAYDPEANAARIVACVNACAGIQTEQLGSVRDLASALEGMLSEWDKLTRYGSPMAKAANKQVALARAALAPFRKD